MSVLSSVSLYNKIGQKTGISKNLKKVQNNAMRTARVDACLEEEDDRGGRLVNVKLEVVLFPLFCLNFSLSLSFTRI